MIEQLPDEVRFRLFERVAATTIANRAVLKCLVVGLPLTSDNVIGLVDDFVDDPQAPAVQDLMIDILEAVDEFVELWERTASLRRN